MANALYNKAKTGLMNEEIKMLVDVVGVYLVTASYALALTTDDYLDDVPSQHIVARGTLANVAVASTGVVDADDSLLTLVTGSIVTKIILAIDTGNIATSPLLAALDTATGLPLTPNGGNVTIQWDSGASKIFAL